MRGKDFWITDHGNDCSDGRISNVLIEAIQDAVSFMPLENRKNIVFFFVFPPVCSTFAPDLNKVLICYGKNHFSGWLRS